MEPRPPVVAVGKRNGNVQMEFVTVRHYGVSLHPPVRVLLGLMELIALLDALLWLPYAVRGQSQAS
jgi:hypothetical protein